MKYPVLLLKSVQKMVEDFHSLLTDKDKKKLAGFMRKLGFDDIAATLYDLPEESERKVRIVRSNELGFMLLPFPAVSNNQEINSVLSATTRSYTQTYFNMMSSSVVHIVF